MNKEVIIIGAGGHGRVIADIVKKSGDILFGYLDDDLSKPNVIGKIDDCIKYTEKFFIIAVGDNGIRKTIAQKYPDLKYYTAIHPSSVAADDAQLGKGTCVMAHAVLSASAVVGEHCIINTASVIEHDDKVGNYSHVSPGSVLCGNVKLGECVHIGAGAIVKNNVSITSDCVVGAGATVVCDIVDAGTYVGVPARKLIK